jgi:hypothetical protein
MKRPLTHLGTTPSGKKVFLEKLPHEYPRFSKSDHLYAAALHGANRTRGGAVADLHRLAAGEGAQRSHATKRDPNKPYKPPTWKQMAADYERRAKSAKREGGKVVRYPHGDLLILPVEGASEYYYSDWQADELLEKTKREYPELLKHMSIEDLLLAQSQGW